MKLRPPSVLVAIAVAAHGCTPGAPAPSSGAATTAGASATGSAASSPPPTASAVVGGDLRFRGTVTSIEAHQEGDEPSRNPWVVTMKVDEVLAGAFAGKTFGFRVHSPSRSGLAVGGTYTVEARWNGSGYVVDPLQWRLH